MRFLALLVAVAAAQQQSLPQANSVPQQPLTPCQTCCSPGGDCSKASHGTPGVCCGQVNGGGAGFCCPADAKCFPCRDSYRCYRGIRPSSSICALDGGSAGGRRSGGGAALDEELVSSVVGLVAIAFLGFAVYNCMRAHRQVSIPHHSGIAMAPVPHAGSIPMGKPMPAGAAGIPVAHAAPVAGGASMYGPGCYGGGYGGGTVAMGAGMGFLGGMMMGEMMADAGHHGGGGYYGGDGGYGGDMGGGDMGGGGDFAADM